ncbi:MAG: zinc finger domain-containing protein, partial [bacterium]
KPESIFFETFDEPNEVFLNFEIADKFDKLIKIRDIVLAALEKARDKKAIGSSLEAKVILKANSDDYELLRKVDGNELKDLFITSGAVPEKNNISDITEAIVEKADGEKCARCWKHDISVGSHSDYPDICGRCHSVVSHM